MTTWIRIAIAVMAVALGAVVFVEWRDARREQMELQAELMATKQALSDASTRQQARESDLDKVLAQIGQQKAAVKKPAEIVKALPEVLPLPKALELEDQAAPGSESAGGAADSPRVSLPGEDLKPLYDFALDCKACKAQLSAAQGDLKDEQLKTQALSRERDDALQVARGGTVLKRVLRAAKWFAIGAAAGAVAVKMKR